MLSCITFVLLLVIALTIIGKVMKKQSRHTSSDSTIVNNSAAYDKRYTDRVWSVRSSLKRGDQKQASEITGFTDDYINMVVAFRRKSERVVDVLEEIIAARKALHKKLKSLSVKKLRVAK
jgi:hypothetical protein